MRLFFESQEWPTAAAAAGAVISEAKRGGRAQPDDMSVVVVGIPAVYRNAANDEAQSKREPHFPVGDSATCAVSNVCNKSGDNSVAIDSEQKGLLLG